MENLKIKPLTKEQLLISIDRLTRFKNTETKYLRVFCDIITGNLLSPKFKKQDLENMDYGKLRDFAQEIINYSVSVLELPDCGENYLINQKLYDYEKSVFEINKETEKLLKNKIKYASLLDLIDENSVKNLNWLKALNTSSDIEKLRIEKAFRYPIKKVLIAEGATEETLLPEFAKFCGYDFDKEGVYIMSAGGKNQVVKLYYTLVESLKLPIFVLLDKDAKQNLEQIKPKLRTCDKIHILDCGEFEDLLPIELIKKTLDYELSNISMLEQEMLNAPIPRVQILEEVFKTRGMHEFKKVEFAQMVKRNIQTNSDISPEIQSIIEELKSVEQDKKSVT